MSSACVTVDELRPVCCPYFCLAWDTQQELQQSVPAQCWGVTQRLRPTEGELSPPERLRPCACPRPAAASATWAAQSRAAAVAALGRSCTPLPREQPSAESCCTASWPPPVRTPEAACPRKLGSSHLQLERNHAKRGKGGNGMAARRAVIAEYALLQHVQLGPPIERLRRPLPAQVVPHTLNVVSTHKILLSGHIDLTTRIGPHSRGCKSCRTST